MQQKRQRIRLLRRLTAATVALTFVGVGAAVTSASADTPSEGLWYYDKFHVKEAHDAGWTGKGVTIAVIDTAIYPDLPMLQGSNLEIVEPSVCKDKGGKYLPATSSKLGDAQHGTNVTGYIAGTGRGYSGKIGIIGVAPGAEVRFYAAGIGSLDSVVACGAYDQTNTSTGLSAAFRKAIDDGADIISVSIGAKLDENSADLVADALRNGVIVVGGLPNERGLDQPKFPGGANGAVGVQAVDSSARVEMTDGVQNQSVNVDIAGPGVGVLGQGRSDDWRAQAIQDGTSYATPIVAGFLADVMQKYPKATSNQILQSMIRTTGASLHEPERDNLTGYGVISLTEMLKTDPTQFPDVNPLVTKDESARPTWEQIYGKASSSSKATESPGDTGKPSSGTAAPAAGESSNRLMVASIAIGALVLIAGLIVIVIVGIRASRNRAPQA